MKRYIAPIFMIASPLLAGGISGGGGVPALQNMDTLTLMSVSLQQLPKGYADADELRLASMRLGVKGTETTDLTVDDEKIQVRKLRGSFVDEKLSKEILPQ